VKAAVLGAGSWGTTLAIHLAKAGHEVRLWGRDRESLGAIGDARENRKFLPGITLPDQVKVQLQLDAALDRAEITLFVVPSQSIRGVAEAVAATKCRSLWVSASKGLEASTHERLSSILAAVLGGPAPVVRTGPSHAEEVAHGIPTSVVAASSDESNARAVQQACSTDRLRVYRNDDVAGCEFAAALKNVIAIAAGVGDGLGFGDNTKAALLTRGLAEMARLGTAMGGRRETFFGLAGMGDLIATATSRHSRNRHVGEALGRGATLERTLAEMVMVAEGVHTARAARDLGRSRGLELPITEQVCAMLFEGVRPDAALQALMSRDLKREA